IACLVDLAGAGATVGATLLVRHPQPPRKATLYVAYLAFAKPGHAARVTTWEELNAFKAPNGRRAPSKVFGNFAPREHGQQ
ncbi:MAG TPA: hypothetical protein VJV79_31320, partial [Polyangiaceae bacterium]|nr:hypothetical protein [Polyangiaceae bacterium]